MLRLIWFIIKVALLAALLIWLGQLPGQVSVDWQGWQIQTSLALTTIALVVALFIVLLALQLLRKLRRIPKQLTGHESNLSRGLSLLTDGMVALAAGETTEARKKADQANKLMGKHQTIGLLLSARAAALEGDDVAATKAYQKITQDKSKGTLLGLKGQLNQALKNQNLELALKLANQANKKHPKTQWVLLTRLNLETRLADWHAAEKTVKQLSKAKLIPPESAKHFNALIALELSRQATVNKKGSDALSYAKDAFRLVNGFAPTAVHYAMLVAADGRSKRASTILQTAWQQHPHPSIANAYYQLFVGQSPDTQLKNIQRLIADHTHHRDAQLLLVRYYLDNDSPNDARETLVTLLDDDPSYHILSMMIDVETKCSGNLKAIQAWQQRLNTALPDPTWVCSDCGQPHQNFHSLCRHCHSFGSLNWQRPDIKAHPKALSADIFDTNQPPKKLK